MFRHPLWSLGFRPLFLLAFVAGVVLPPLWAAIFAGAIALPADGVPPLAWHAHEMFYGFGWAVLGGFLLTASRAWLQIRGMHGGMLAFATALWLVERAAVFIAPSPLRTLLLDAYLVFVIGYLVNSLVRYRDRGAADNAWFVLFLPIYLVAKNLLLSPAGWAAGVTMTVALFRLPFVIMFERLITMTLRNALQTEVPRRKALEHATKALLAVAIFQPWLPPMLAVVVLAAAALLLLVRLWGWKPLVAMRRFEVGVMHVGVFGLALHLALAAGSAAGWLHPVGTLATHTFTLLDMGLVIPPMLLRVCQGHTGRPIVFTPSDKAAIWIMGAAAFFRLVMPQLAPASYTTWIALAATGWSLCFLIIGLRVGPYLLQARLDGKEF